MNKFVTFLFVLAAIVASMFVGFASSVVCRHTECLFGFAMMLLFPLAWSILAYGSQRTRFTSSRLFWTISLIVSVAAWILIFGGTCVTSYESSNATEAGDWVAQTPVIESFYLWQRPWLIYRVYLDAFHADMGLFVFAVFWGLLLPVMGILSVRHLWLVFRRRRNN
ncbi:MAG: hypothetical protein HYV35_05895 [Lentisphaerae bacterium]|nr:hypothetical protein [Lentisphaerota bacterium]